MVPRMANINVSHDSEKAEVVTYVIIKICVIFFLLSLMTNSLKTQ